MTAATLAWREMVEKQGSSGLVLPLLQEPAANVIYPAEHAHSWFNTRRNLGEQGN
jgi:hypothetical protein